MYIARVTLTGQADKLFPGFPGFPNGKLFTRIYIDANKKGSWLKTLPGFQTASISESADKTKVTLDFVFDSEENARNYLLDAEPQSCYYGAATKENKIEYITSQGITRTIEYVPA